MFAPAIPDNPRSNHDERVNQAVTGVREVGFRIGPDGWEQEQEPERLLQLYLLCLIKDAMHQQGITQAELASRMNIRPVSVSIMLRSQGNLTMASLGKIFRWLDLFPLIKLVPWDKPSAGSISRRKEQQRNPGINKKIRDLRAKAKEIKLQQTTEMNSSSLLKATRQQLIESFSKPADKMPDLALTMPHIAKSSNHPSRAGSK